MLHNVFVLLVIWTQTNGTSFQNMSFSHGKIPYNVALVDRVSQCLPESRRSEILTQLVDMMSYYCTIQTESG